MIKNWKTTLIGVLGAMPALLNVFHIFTFSGEQLAAITALFVALGFTQTKDKDVTGAGAHAKRIED